MRIELVDVSKHWGRVTAVDRVSFTAPAGELLVILGPSGCGKSTILRLIAGLEQSTAGTIKIGDQDVTHLPPARRNVSMVFQSYALFPHLTVAENIIFGLKVRRVEPAERARRLARTADLLGLNELLARKPAQLSGGQRQRVALGRAIVSEAPVCLMDEPLSNLDAKLRHEMRKEIRLLQQRLGITMVYVTHDQVEAMTMADSIALLHAGRLVQFAPPADLYARPATLFAASFLGAPPMNLLPLADGPGGAVVAGSVPPGQGRRGGPEGAPGPGRSPEEGAWPPVAGGSEVALPGRAGAGLILGIRPEKISLTETNGHPAEVVAVEYLGSDSILSCRLAGHDLAVRLQGRSLLKPGQAVGLAWPAEEVHLFEADSGRRI